MSKTRRKIFLSSAMEPNDLFDWRKIRLDVKKKLRTCDRLEVYDIAEYASPNMATQEMRYHVKTSDYVVQIMGKELRDGTKKEFYYAKEFNKKVFSFFLECSNINENLNKHIASLNNQHLYNREYTPDNIAEAVFDNVLEHVFNQEDYYELPVSNSIMNMQFSEEGYLVKKDNIDETKNHTIGFLHQHFGKLGQKSETKYNKKETVFLKVLRMLIGQSNNLDKQEVISILEEDKGEKIDEWLIDRIDAFISYFCSYNYKLALNYLDDALSKLDSSDVLKWIVNDINIDARNMEKLINNINGRYVVDSKYQRNIQSSDFSVFSPQSDRYQKNAKNFVLNEISKIELSSESTVHLGSNLPNALVEIEKSAIISFFNLSIVGFEQARLVLADTLYSFGSLYSDPDLLFESLKMYVLLKNNKKVDQIISSHWETISDKIIVSSNELVSFANQLDVKVSNELKLILYKHVGNFISDEHFLEYTVFVNNYYKNVTNSNVRIFLSAIYATKERINQNIIAEIVIDLLDKERLVFLNDILRLLIEIDLTELREGLKSELVGVLKKNEKRIIEESNMTEVFSIIASKDSYFLGLAEEVESKLNNPFKMYHRLNLKVEQFEDDVVIDSLLSEVKFQIKQNKGGVYHTFNSQPIQTLANLNYSRAKVKSFRRIVEEKVIPEFKEMLISDVHSNIKQDILEFLIKYKLESLRNGFVSITDRIPITNVESDKLKYDLFKSHTLLNIEILNYCLESMNSRNSSNFLLDILDINKLNIHERVTLSKSMSSLMEFDYLSKKKSLAINSYLMSKLSQDSSSNVRLWSVRGNYYLMLQENDVFSETIIYSLISDSYYYVKKSMMNFLNNDRNRFSKYISSLEGDLDFRIKNSLELE